MITISTIQAVAVGLILIGIGVVFGGWAVNIIMDARMRRLEEEVEREYGGFCQGREGTE